MEKNLQKKEKSVRTNNEEQANEWGSDLGFLKING